MRTVSVFGGSRPKEGDPAYEEARRLGRLLAERGLAVASGGYIGTMEAVSRGAAEAGGRVIGVTCERIEAWRGVRPNRWVQEEIRCPTLLERAFRLAEVGEALIALPGGVGTLAEVAGAWSWLQTGELPPRPLVLVGELWDRTLEAFLTGAQGYVSEKDVRLLRLAPDVPTAVEVVVQMLPQT